MDEITKSQFSKLRKEMVDNAIFARGVRSELVLHAMRSVPRERFLPAHLREFAYDDAPLPIEEGQTISQPYIVAFMTEALALCGGEKVLEIGAGSGYAAAVLSDIAADVYTVERHGPLAEKAAATLADLDESSPNYPRRKDFLESVQVAADAVCEHAGRYAKLAREMAEQTEGQRKDELLAIARRCERVPALPPRDFVEALQSILMT